MADDCIFCSPAEGAVVLESDQGIVLLDEPVRPGHVLIGIKTHSPSLHDADPTEVGAMMQLATNASKAIVEHLAAEKTYVVAIGDKDKHFHVHLVPKFADDPPMGPHIFSPSGWAQFLPTEVNADDVDRVSDVLRGKLS